MGKGGGEEERHTSIAMINNIKDRYPPPTRIPPLPTLRIPLRRPPQRPRRILHVHRVDPQVPIPQPLHLLAQLLVDARQTQRRPDELVAVVAVHVRQPHHHQVQPLDLPQLFFRRQLPFRHLQPGFGLVGLFARGRVRLVHHARANFDEGGHVPFCGFAARGHGEVQRAQSVHFVVLRVACFAAAVEDVGELLAVGAVEDAGEGF